jgi:hypothetical protein
MAATVGLRCVFTEATHSLASGSLQWRAGPGGHPEESYDTADQTAVAAAEAE